MDLLSTICILVAGALWGLMGVFVRYLTDLGLTTVQVTAVRIITAAVFFLVFLLVTDRGKLKIKLKDIWVFFGMGVGSVMLMSLCYFSTMQAASLSAAAILLYTSPIFVMLMSILFLGEKFTVQKLMALICAFAGCVCVTGIGNEMSVSGSGVITGLLSGFSYALYSIFGTVALKKYHSYTVSSYAFFFAAAGELVICNIPDLYQRASSSVMPGRMLAVILLMALLTAFAPYLLYTYGLKGVETSKAAIMATIEPMVATILGIVVFHERMELLSAVGIGLIMLAILVLNNFGRPAVMEGSNEADFSNR